MERIFLSTGSNLGDRMQNLKKIVKLLEDNGIRIVKESKIYETEPYGYKAQEWFYNQVLEVETILSPLELLNLCKKLEREIGRRETFKWGPRIIDVDLLIYGERIVDSPELKVPHPFLHERRFVLAPLNELIPDYRPANFSKSVNQLLNECVDAAIVRPV